MTRVFTTIDELKTPPHSDEAERGVLGSILLDPEAIEKCESIKAECFYDRRHQALYDSFLTMHMAGKYMDALTIGEWLKANNVLDHVGGYDYLVELQDETLVPAHVEHYCDIVIEKWQRRMLIDHAQKAVECAYRGDAVSEVGANLSAGLDAVGNVSASAERTTEQLCADALEMDTKVADGELIGLPLPWIDFQSKTFGIPIRAVTPMAGRDGKGKSRLATFLAEFWVSRGIPILYFAFEDGAERFVSNVAASRGGYDMFTIKREHVPDDFMPNHRKVMSEVSRLPLYVEDYPSTAEEIATIIAKHKRKHGIQGVVIDGFKDMVPTTGENQTSKENHMTAILVRACKRHNLAIIPISHLNKIDDDKWIRKTDITGAGNQFKSARMVLLYQDHIPQKMRDEYGAYGDEIILDATKSSYGGRGLVMLRPELERGRFVEVRKND